jgi:hypothetical protein
MASSAGVVRNAEQLISAPGFALAIFTHLEKAEFCFSKKPIARPTVSLMVKSGIFFSRTYAATLANAISQL